MRVRTALAALLLLSALEPAIGPGGQALGADVGRSWRREAAPARGARGPRSRARSEDAAETLPEARTAQRPSGTAPTVRAPLAERLWSFLDQASQPPPAAAPSSDEPPVAEAPAPTPSSPGWMPAPPAPPAPRAEPHRPAAPPTPRVAGSTRRNAGNAAGPHPLTDPPAAAPAIEPSSGPTELAPPADLPTADEPPAEGWPQEEASDDPTLPSEGQGGDGPEIETPSAESLSAEPPAAEPTEGPPSAGAETPSADPAPPTDHASPEPLTPELVQLRDVVRRCLKHYYDHPESAVDRSPWAVMHAGIAFGVDSRLLVNGAPVNCLGHLCWNGVCRGMRLMSAPGGQLRVHNGPGVQGHDGQLLAILAQSYVPQDFALRVDGRDFTVADLIAYEQATCRPRTELTFKLIAFSYYLDHEARWRSNDGQSWDMPKLIREELAQPVSRGACGGTHRMMGFSQAVHARRNSGGAFTGEWERARQYVEAMHAHAFRLQNADGSFSTAWFRGPGPQGTIERRLDTTGHTLEWLAFSLTDQELRSERLLRAARYLAQLMLDNPDHDWPIGPKGHALHALVMLDQRLFGAQPGQGGPQLAEGHDGWRERTR